MRGRSYEVLLGFQTVDTDFSPGDSTVGYTNTHAFYMKFQTVDTDFSPGDIFASE